MTFQGLDYNTSRSHLRMPEYGRGIHLMIQHCIALEDRAERQRCAEAIIDAMARIKPEVKMQTDYEQKLWDHLAIMSDFKLDIDYPCEVTTSEKYSQPPTKVPYGRNAIPVRHYGNLIFKSIEHLKGMTPGEERDEFLTRVANQMKRDIVMYGNAGPDNERVMGDIERFTEGTVTVPEDFVFEYINLDNRGDDKRKRKKK